MHRPLSSRSLTSFTSPPPPHYESFRKCYLSSFYTAVSHLAPRFLPDLFPVWQRPASTPTPSPFRRTTSHHHRGPRNIAPADPAPGASRATTVLATLRWLCTANDAAPAVLAFTELTMQSRGTQLPSAAEVLRDAIVTSVSYDETEVLATELARRWVRLEGKARDMRRWREKVVEVARFHGRMEILEVFREDGNG
ncbi:hypothetical protein HDU96_003846 [Phlyctochytrium bullatum]|nr:hypothetical protein HDU96_003846 [Phlyctochytrium bullatum]